MSQQDWGRQDWRLNSETEIVVDVPVARLWAALTDAEEAQRYFMGARVTTGDVGEAYRVERGDGWRVSGIVLVKDAPHRLRVTWGIKAPAGVAMPNCEVEYRVEPADALQVVVQSKLTIREYIDGPLPPHLADAGRSGWAMIARNLKAYLG
ncbi:SRPBCC domain-containing protein [Mesorhizobium sp. PAMC28654]|uniref:SRPBCC domain-containing protein n=1 Tax=Mesorhizobium sp. PAMC28654 TaxID=2880934 RepID=UPI001D0BA022|nr:SRPBCC domain-containing protein [Mesorhizobium sp. PAMC28654]UDL89310.1 SRPBCC domain-containing protein [Mesorhizobium sp. PAMC28654]